MRNSDIITIKKAHQTVGFTTLLKSNPSAIFLQLSTHTQDHFLSLVQALKKMDFFICTSLVKKQNTLSLFKCITVVASKNYKSWQELDLCVRTIKNLYPTAIFFFFKDRAQFISLNSLSILQLLEKQPYPAITAQCLLDPFMNSVLLNSQQFIGEVLHWLDTK